MESPQEEVLITSWHEPSPATTPTSRRYVLLVIVGIILIIILFITLGIITKDWSWYLAVLVVVAATSALYSERKNAGKTREISLTNVRVVVDERSYPLSDMAGFWLDQTQNQLVITFEQKRRALLPLTCFYATADHDKAQETLLQVLPEIEPRPAHFTDQLNRYFHF